MSKTNGNGAAPAQDNQHTMATDQLIALGKLVLPPEDAQQVVNAARQLVPTLKMPPEFIAALLGAGIVSAKVGGTLGMVRQAPETTGAPESIQEQRQRMAKAGLVSL